MTLKIRTFTSADRKFVLSLVTRFSEFMLPEWRRAEEIDHTNQASHQKAMDNPAEGELFFIAEDSTLGRVGFIHLQSEIDYFTGESTGYIADLVVDPAYSGRGAGSLLLDSAEKWAQEKGYHLLTLYVFEGNQHARAIYEHRGFKPEVIKYVKMIGKKS